jgi:predicted nucleic acid-binding protein
VEEILEAVAGFGIVLDARPVEARVLALARGHGLTVCDALYLELALRREAALMTLDAALARAAEAEGVARAAG